MDSKLQAMMERRRKAQQEAEDAEWESPMRRDSPPVRRPTPPRAATPPRPASPPPVQAAAPPSPPQSHTFEAATNGGAAVGAESGGSPRAAGGGEDDLAAAMRDLGFSPSLAVDAAPPAEADPVDIDPGAAAAAHAPSVPQAAPDPPEAAAPAPDPALSPAAAPAAKKKKKKPAAPASGGEGAGREMDTKAFAYKVTAGEQPVPVLVLADSQAGQWRQSAQSVSSAYNGLVGASGTGGPGAEGEARGRPGGGRVGRSSTLANPRARVLGALSPRGIGTGSLFDEGDGLSASGAEAEDPRSLSPPVARRARGAGRGSRSTSVPAGARAGLLENNVLALSTGSVEERASAARRICARAKSTEQLRQLVDAGAVESVGRLLAEPRGMAAAVDALLPLCALVGGAERSPEAQAVLRDFCAEVANNNIAERLAALLCWASTVEEVKGRIATLMFHMAKDATLANRILRQDGAVKALVGLLDSESAAVNSSAAAALANITYWSTDPVARYTHVKVLCAV